jgi:hypothetical protein
MACHRRSIHGSVLDAVLHSEVEADTEERAKPVENMLHAKRRRVARAAVLATCALALLSCLIVLGIYLTP